MNNILKIGLGFLGGAIAGATGSYFYWKNKSTKELNKHLEEIDDVYIKKINKNAEFVLSPEDGSKLEEIKNDVVVTSSFEKPNLVDYLKEIKKNHYDYTNPASELEKDTDEDEAIPDDVTFISTTEGKELKNPYPIKKSELGNDGRNVMYFTQYGVDQIMDEDDGHMLNELEIEDRFGEDHDSFFHEHAINRKLCIRNDIENADYEILYDDSYTP